MREIRLCPSNSRSTAIALLRLQPNRQAVELAGNIEKDSGSEPFKTGMTAKNGITGVQNQLSVTNVAQDTQNSKGEPMRVGRATVIQHPYQGETPTQTRKQQSTWQEIQKESLLAAEEKMENAQELSTRTGKSVKTFLKNLYEIDFDATGGKREILISGMEFEGKPYVVTLHKSAVGKVISQKITPESIAVLNHLQTVIENGSYVGSGDYVQHGKTKKPTTRFDYFETPVRFGEKSCIVTFDVEAFPNVNNYKTHKVNHIELIDTSNADTGPLPAANEAPPALTNSIIQTAPNSKGKSDGIGAADAGFDPYSAAMNEYGTIDEGEHPARPIDTPKRMEPDTKVSLTARTVQEAEATPEKRLQTIQDAIVGGTLSYIPVSNAEAAQRAEETIGRDGWSKALNDWTADARAGMSSEDLTAMGATLLNNMGNSDATGEQYVDLLFDYTTMLRSAGQAVQAARILKQLTPEGRLYCVQKTVNRINEGKRDAGREPTVKLGGEEIGIIGQAREEALQTLRELGERPGEPEEYGTEAGQADPAAEWVENIGKQAAREHGVPVEDWVTEIGKQLEQNLSARLNPKKPKAQPIAKTILNDLVQFAEERALPKQAAVKKSAADRLYNFFHNRAAYAEAWSTAQTALREKYKGNPAALAAFDKWLATSPEQLYGEKAMRDAVLEAIVTQDTDVKQIAGRVQLGDEASVLDEIYETVAGRIQPDAADARAIKNAIAKALVTIAEGKPSQSTDALVRAKLKEMGEKMSGIIREGGKSKADVAKNLSRLLIAEYNISPEAAGSVSKNIVDSFNRQVEEASRKALQARFGKRLPSHRKSQLEKFEELGNLGAFSSDRFNAHATKLIFQTEGVRLNPDLAKRYLDADTDAMRDKVMEEIQQNIADQLPATFMEKFTALRYLNMLGNMKTQVRNVVSNIGFQPMRMVKDRIGAGLETVASQLSGGKVQRTKSFVASPTLYKEAWGDFEAVRKEAMGNGKYQDGTLRQLDRDIDEKRRIFKLPPLEGARKLTNWAMEVGDSGFSRFTYADALAGFLQAGGAKNIAGTDPALLDAARNYAIRQAQQATYRDNNAFSDMIADMRFRRPGNNVAKRVANVAGEGLLPFRRTPANILVRAEEYSPIGLVNTIVQAVQAKRGKATGADVIESLSKALTGSGICALGAWLFLEGFLRGSDDEDKKQANFDRLLGHQAYSLELPGGQSYTLDWLAPASMPLFVGVQFAEAAADKGLTFKELLSVLGAISDPMLQMSMMQGVNDALSHLSYADEAALPTLVANSLVNYMTQGVTSTLFGQMERITEQNRMTTYVDKNSPLPDSWQRMLGKASAKIPGWDYHQVEYIDAWGRKQSKGELPQRLVDQLINPAYTSQVKADEVEQELQRLADATHNTGVFPTAAPKSFAVDGETKYLTAGEYTTYAKARGERSHALLQEAFALNAYRDMDEEERADYIEDLYTLANEAAKDAATEYQTDKNWVKNAETAKRDLGITPAEYVALKQLYGTEYLTGEGYAKTKEAVSAGIPIEACLGFRGEISGYTADHDTNGKTISGSKKQKVLAEIDAMPLSGNQKTALYYAAGYKESTLDDAPWYGKLEPVGSEYLLPAGKGKLVKIK